MRQPAPKPDKATEATGLITDALMTLATAIPSSDEPTATEPRARAHIIAARAAARAAAISGSLALPPGPFGLLTVIPDLMAIWRIQQQVVVDIAGAYGQKASLRRELMVYCLFRHGAAQLARELVVRVGQRYLVRRVTLRVLQQALEKIGVRLTQRVISRGLSRYVPVVGAVAIGAYAYMDTMKVAKTAIETFSHPIDVEEDPPEEPAETGRLTRSAETTGSAPDSGAAPRLAQTEDPHTQA